VAQDTGHPLLAEDAIYYSQYPNMQTLSTVASLSLYPPLLKPTRNPLLLLLLLLLLSVLCRGSHPI
jgi:hypothetical protein